MRTLETILTTCGQLQSGVNIRAILSSLIDRLANYATRGEAIPEDIKIFTIFSTQIAEVVRVSEILLLLPLLSSLLTNVDRVSYHIFISLLLLATIIDAS